MASALLSAASVSIASGFHAHAFGDQSEDGYKIIDPVVTDKFVKHFPKERWTIVIMSKGYIGPNGGGFAHATVGISPAGNIPLVPRRQYSSYKTNTDSASPTPKEIADLERAAIRRATEGMMIACEQSPKCAVYKPY